MLEKVYLSLRDNIAAGHFTDEVEVAHNAVLPLLHALSWPVSGQPDIVSLKHPPGEQRVDYTLCNPPKAPVVSIEVRQFVQSGDGHSNETERQFFERAVRRGVQMAILTNGSVWLFFLPTEQGDYEDRLVPTLDTTEHES